VAGGRPVGSASPMYATWLRRLEKSGQTSRPPKAKAKAATGPPLTVRKSSIGPHVAWISPGPETGPLAGP